MYSVFKDIESVSGLIQSQDTTELKFCQTSATYVRRNEQDKGVAVDFHPPVPEVVTTMV
jgi:hypothetical protein